jgi:glycosyltransferase involved in cell wall biosynthesis
MRIVFDGREFVTGRLTGIGRVLSGLVAALSGDSAVEEVILSVNNSDAVPESLKRIKKVTLKKLPGSFIGAENALSGITKRGAHCFISPYPKLPIFGTHCPSIHTIHDVLDLTHTAYRKDFRVYLDKFRLKKALATADLTWYDSFASRQETENLMGYSGGNPRVRHLGLEEKFSPKRSEDEDAVLDQYELHRGYILIVGNGLPHKNLGILIESSSHIKRKLAFVGVSKRNQAYWRFLCPEANAVWLNYVKDEDLPVIFRNAFCLAQPSTAEGYGYPPLEAMACGVPAVISDIPVLVETTGGHALAADPHETDAWVEVFEKLEKKAFYRAQVEKGLKWVQPFIGLQGWTGHVADVKEVIEGS